jgi:NADH-quinone oxidoreductase subunit D
VSEPAGSVRQLATGVTAVPANGDQPEEELLTINFGPHHPATHGVLRLLVTLRAEQVLEAIPYIGYVHTGIEKSCEDKSYWKVIPLVERMDYLAYYFNAMAFCMSVERLLDEEVPERAQYLRVIHCELNRIHSHLVWLGTTALDLGAISIFWYCFRERDRVLDLFEYSSGQRMHTRYIQVGGVADDIPAGWADKALQFTTEMEHRVGQYEAILDGNEIFLQRTRDVGVVPQDRLLDLGVTGPLLRAAGNPWDLRKATPYSSYDKFDFKVPVGTVGDCYDRYRVRVAEIRESCKIVRQAIEGLPEGPYITTNRKVALPPRHELATSMEALIHHFKLVTEGFRVPPGEAYVPIESPRGEMGCFVVADGSAKPSRVHMRDPSFVNLQALREMVVGGYIADMITNLAMLDPILGGIDR